MENIKFDFDRQTLFIYIIIMIAIVFYFSKQNITSGFVFGVGVALAFYGFVQKTNQTQIDQQNNKIKQSTIKPVLKNANKYDDVTDFLFSVQDFYYNNPQSYIDMSKSLDDFFDIYQEQYIDNAFDGYAYTNLQMKKRDILNEFAYIGAGLPSSEAVDKKMDIALKRLEDILNKYMDISYKNYKNYIHKTGYQSNITNVYIGPVPSNTYDNILEPFMKEDNSLF